LNFNVLDIFAPDVKAMMVVEDDVISLQ
jgi:hypothetical protein